MACKQPVTSKLSKKETKDEEFKKLKAEERREYHRILVSSEREKIKNADKIRLRKLPRLGDRSPLLAAITVLNNMFEADISPEDIVHSETVTSWVETEPNDLVVTFKNQDVRNSVYNKRTKENKGLYMICDELGEERLMIWQKLVKNHGLKKVYTKSGGVHLQKGNKSHRFLTLSELEKFYDLHGY